MKNEITKSEGQKHERGTQDEKTIFLFYVPDPFMARVAVAIHKFVSFVAK